MAYCSRIFQLFVRPRSRFPVRRKSRVCSRVLTHEKPPLRFYLAVISSRPWTGVTVISNANGRENQVNPTFDALEQLASEEVMTANVTMLRVGWVRGFGFNRMQVRQ